MWGLKKNIKSKYFRFFKMKEADPIFCEPLITFISLQYLLRKLLHRLLHTSPATKLSMLLPRKFIQNALCSLKKGLNFRHSHGNPYDEDCIVVTGGLKQNLLSIVLGKPPKRQDETACERTAILKNYSYISASF